MESPNVQTIDIDIEEINARKKARKLTNNIGHHLNYGEIALNSVREAIGEKALNIQGGINDIYKLNIIKNSLGKQDNKKAQDMSDFFEVESILNTHLDEIEFNNKKYINFDIDGINTDTFEIVEQKGDTFIVSCYLEIEEKYQKRFFVFKKQGVEPGEIQNALGGYGKNAKNIGLLSIDKIEGIDNFYRVAEESYDLDDVMEGINRMLYKSQGVKKFDVGGNYFIGEDGETKYFDIKGNVRNEVHQTNNTVFFIGQDNTLRIFNTETKKEKYIQTDIVNGAITNYFTGQKLHYQTLEGDINVFLYLESSNIKRYLLINTETLEYIESDQRPIETYSGIRYLPIGWNEDKKFYQSKTKPTEEDYKYLS